MAEVGRHLRPSRDLHLPLLYLCSPVTVGFGCHFASFPIVSLFSTTNIFLVSTHSFLSLAFSPDPYPSVNPSLHPPPPFSFLSPSYFFHSFLSLPLRLDLLQPPPPLPHPRTAGQTWVVQTSDRQLSKVSIFSSHGCPRERCYRWSYISSECSFISLSWKMGCSLFRNLEKGKKGGKFRPGCQRRVMDAASPAPDHFIMQALAAEQNLRAEWSPPTPVAQVSGVFTRWYTYLKKASAHRRTHVWGMYICVCIYSFVCF